MILQERDIALLRSLLESRIMTVMHIAALHFKGRNEATKKRLQKLKAHGYIRERRRRVSDPSILSLTAQAFALLKTEGILAEYPSFDQSKRSRVSDLTIRHELEVLDVKAAYHSAIQNRSGFSMDEFCTWPACYEFVALSTTGCEILVKPDGFICVHEAETGSKGYEHFFFLEVDRSSETQDTLVNRIALYASYHKSGGFAEWRGGKREEFKEYPFRVLVVLKTAERRNNLAERLLQMNPPILTRACLTTLAEVKLNPLGPIWIRPLEYREATKGSSFDPERERKVWGYRRQTERELLVEERIKKFSLFDSV
jgi:hypothetical protein